MSARRLLLATCAVVLVAGGCTILPRRPLPAPDPFAQNARLGRGVNLGNALDAPAEGEWGVTLESRYFDLIAQAGFTSVRIPIRWSAHAAAEPPYTIDPAFFERVDWAVTQALARGLAVIVDTHHYLEIFERPEEHRERFLALTGQIAERYRDDPPEVCLEMLNEPHDKLTPELWNDLLAETIRVIRSVDERRTILVGTAHWGGFGGLDRLRLPAAESNLIVTIHYYDPFRFTHQGAEWVGDDPPPVGTTWNGTKSELADVTRDFERAAQWGREHGRPLHVGEFGAYSKADLYSRARWTAYVAREAERLGMSWAYWEFCAGFGVYDPKKNTWNEPLMRSLIPGWPGGQAATE